jgi:hypothetical protein
MSIQDENSGSNRLLFFFILQASHSIVLTIMTTKHINSMMIWNTGVMDVLVRSDT